ncbi:MAG: hypothetical protein JWO83_2097 [Caulobacteraceae bacterium]|nr:hypothetical protein [Caulobacteraceae bacterium]
MLLAGSVAVLSMAACNKTPGVNQAAASPPPGALPLDPNAPTAPPAYAPAANALPQAPPAPVYRLQSREARYRYVARAEEYNNGFSDSPPDYAVDYGGARPWYWRAQNGAYRVVEPTPEGDRYYYYEPGADQPFLVRDPQYTYGYDNGQLAVVYDAYGRPMPDYTVSGQAYQAGRYLARARALYEAAQRDRHEAAYASYWQAGQNDLMRQQQEWAREQQRNADWQAWQSQNAPNAYAWQQEANVRHAYAQAYAPRGAPAYPPGPPPAQPAPYPAALPPPGLAATQQAQQAQQAQLAQVEAARRAQQAAQTQAAQAQQAQAAAARQAQIAQGQQQQLLAEAGRRAAAQQVAQAQQAQAAAARQARIAQGQQQQLQAEAGRRAAAQQAAQAQAAQAQARQAQAAQAQAQARQAAAAREQQAHAAKPDNARKQAPDQKNQPPAP